MRTEAECEGISAAVWQIQNTSQTRHSSKRLWSRRKIQINYTSFFKKLLRFSIWNILLKRKKMLKRLLSWLQKIFFIFLKIVFVWLPSDAYFASVIKSGSKVEIWKEGKKNQVPLSDQTKSLQSFGGVMIFNLFVCSLNSKHSLKQILKCIWCFCLNAKQK